MPRKGLYETGDSMRKVEWRCPMMRQRHNGGLIDTAPCEDCYSVIVVSIRVPFDPESLRST